MCFPKRKRRLQPNDIIHYSIHLSVNRRVPTYFAFFLGFKIFLDNNPQIPVDIVFKNWLNFILPHVFGIKIFTQQTKITYTEPVHEGIHAQNCADYSR